MNEPETLTNRSQNRTNPYFDSAASSAPKKLTVVGIGASAGGVPALTQFFDALTADSGMAFVVVTHMAPDQQSFLPQILQKHTRMAVRQVRESLAVEPNHVYVISPGKQLLMTDSHVDVGEFPEPRGHRTPIDDFFRSLAAAHREAAAVILSGSGTDGAVGIKTIKEKDGLLLVQHPDEAEFDGMPRAAIATGLADVVLPVAQLAEKLVAFYQNGRPVSPDPTQLSDQEQSILSRILMQVQNQTGHDLSQYQHATLLRRIIRRMNLHKFRSLDSYLAHLRYTPEEAHTLFNDLFVGVTTFFRSPQSWEALGKQVVPRLFADKESGERLRVWSIGCATGEEAYSLAILLVEEAARQWPEQSDKELLDKAAAQIQIFASDLSEQVLQRARQGLYPEVIEADLSQERLARFFVKEGVYYHIRPELRDMVLFTSHSVLYDPPFSRLDLISSRNLLTHLQKSLRQTVLEIFYYALNPGRYLFLDNLDSLEINTDLFRPLDQANYIYTAQPQPDKHLRIPKAPFSSYKVALDQRHYGAQRPEPKAGSDLPKGDIEQQHREALEAVAPPSLLVNELYQVLHLSERVGRYLQPRRGPVTSDLLKLVRPELQLELRNALTLTFQEQKAVLTVPIPVQFDDAVHQVIISVTPYRKSGSDHSHESEEPVALVCFLENEVLLTDREERHEERAALSPAAGQMGQTAHAAQLEQEVQRLYNRLHAVSEQYEIANEELRLANEELQSTNVEFRNMNDELETSREEIHSINEELRATNQELDQKVSEISRSRSDIENLMAATNIPTIFLDRNLHIQRYTPAATQLLPLQPHDRGRHIAQLAHELSYDSLVEDAQQVLATLITSDREVQDQDGRWLLARHYPYRTLDNRIDGVVLTFIDINELKRSEKELRESESLLAQEVAALRRLHEMTGQVVTVSDMPRALEKILNASMEILGADFGNIQLLDPERGTLSIVAQQGFEQSFLEQLQAIEAEDGSACGRALRFGRRILIEDVAADAAYEPYRAAAAIGGYRAEQCTPLINHKGRIKGVLSTYYRQPTRFSERDERLMDLLAYQAANLIERLHAEDRLEQRVWQRTAQVRQLASELIASEQTVRQRIAQSLHDNLQQTLYAAKIQLQFLRDEIGEKAELEALFRTITESLNLTRQLTVELSPPVLGEEGLVEALQWLAEHMQALYGLEVTVTASDHPDTATEEQRVLLYQIVRELLFNVVKHAGVLEAEVKLEEKEDGLWITVSDQGRGFEAASQTAELRAGFGLRSIHERLQLFDGSAAIDSKQGHGTRVCLFLPHVSAVEPAANEV